METSFQEFGAVSDRRRRDLELRRRSRNVRIGGAVTVVLLVAIVGAVYALYSPEKDAAKQSRAVTIDQFHTTGKSVETLCASTDYRQTCVSSLNKAVKNTTDPKYLVKAAVFVLLDEASAAFNRTRLLADKDPKLRGGVEDCRQLFEDSKDEIRRAVESIAADGIEKIPAKSHDIRTWLSSVMSYQQTCIDGFPEGELKVKLQKAQNTLKEMTSNSLAIIGQLSNFLEMLDVTGLGVGGGRKLLAETVEIGGEEFPSWLPEQSRRVLRETEIKLKANVTVAKDGSGDFKTISEALLNMPSKYHGRYNIYVKAGVYEETVNVTRKMANVTIYGDGATETIVTGDKNFVDGVRTFLTATFSVSGDGFMGINIGIRNTAGAVKHQAVALRVQSDHSIFFHCRFEGYQDTLYAQAKRQFYRSCVISGTVDFIFGDSAAVFQNCLIVLRRPLDNQQNIVLAHGRVDRRETTGFVLHKCKIIADRSLVSDGTNIRSYLGRPWKQFARHIIMESEISGAIVPAGYMPWEGDFGLNTLFYGEAGNTGPGADFAGRVKWRGVRILKNTTVERYTVARFIQGNEWINANRGITIPVRYGLYH
ncbi:putative pectinesterase/pectinesterase inhibitor 45 [Platanthera guangdongensis]|uniref:Pectinesterase n=1 Tax=Platanthera guangdongensis TaxID=2320717 RepID=A0ABR2MPB1_9ASPA